MLYLWRGPEEGLASGCCATELSIEEFQSSTSEKSFTAKGKIKKKDYEEAGIEFEDPWQAVGKPSNSGITLWGVSRPKDDGIFFVNTKTGEPEFTAASDINEAIKKFIAKHLTEYEGKRGREPIVIKPKKYSGALHRYEGACLCHQLINLGGITFNWGEHTKGEFPYNCFECSCGEKWYRISPKYKRWIRVADENAWKMLLEYDGIAIQPLGIYEGKAYLVQTLRDQGLIPLR